MRKKLLLINPVNPLKTGLAINPTTRFQPLGLGIIAALTPEDWEIEIADENFRSIEYKEANLVGLTAFTSSVNRAYEIARIYRNKGTTTVLGGIHASMLPEEALQYVDSVVIGEAESVWPNVIADFEGGELQRIYEGELLELSEIPKPRRDLFNPRYIFGSIQTTRGCPMDCEFCSVTAFNGHRYRQRPVEDVLDELETIHQKKIFFVDDNIIGSGRKAEERAISLFKGIVERRIKKDWFAQASMNVTENEEVLEYAAKSGCRMIFLGVEAEKMDALADINKKTNLSRIDTYEEVFRNVNQHGIAVLGAFIFGMDSDTPEAIYHRIDYIIESGVDAMQTTYLTALPGTRLFNRFFDENRLLYIDFPADWDHYDFLEVTHQPLLIETQDFSDMAYELIDRIYSHRTIWRKFFKTWHDTRSLKTALWAYKFNISYRNVALGVKDSIVKREEE